MGHGFTAQRCEILNTTDGIGIYNRFDTANANVNLYDNYVHDLTYFSPSPTKSDNKTHNDNVQIQGGSSIVIAGNYFHGFLSATTGTQNYINAAVPFGVLVTPNVANVTNMAVTKNWFAGCNIQVNIAPTGSTVPNNIAVSNNYFSHDSRTIDSTYNKVPFNTNSQVGYTESGNTFIEDGTPCLATHYDALAV